MAASTGGKTRPPPIFYGWIVAFAAGLGLAAGVSVFLPYSAGLLIGQFNKAFGWSPPQVLTALTFNTGATLIAAPLTGRIVDRIGAKRVAIFAFVAQALLIASFYYQTDSLAALYLRYVLFALFATGTTAVSYSTLISRWFDRKRGLALGIALAGVGLGGVFWSKFLAYLFGAIGWRATMLYVAAGLIVLILPLQLLLLRDRPEDVGQVVDGAKPTDRAAAVDERQAHDGLTLFEAMRTGRFWLVLLTFFLATCGAYGVTLNLVTILTHEGVPPATAASAQATIALATFVGRISTGWLLDRFFAPRVAFLFVLPGALGAAVLAAGNTSFLGPILIGLSAGAEIDVLAYLVGRYFGLRHFGSIYAVNFGAAALATSIGPLVVALVAGAAGSYSTALAVLVGVFLVAAIMLLCFPRFPARFAAAE